MSQKCPKCGKGNLIHQVEQIFIAFEGENGSVNSFYSMCEYCGFEQVDGEEERLNQDAMDAFYFMVLEKAKVLP